MRDILVRMLREYRGVGREDVTRMLRKNCSRGFSAYSNIASPLCELTCHVRSHSVTYVTCHDIPAFTPIS